MLALKNAGIVSTKPLPVANKTVGKNNDLLTYYTNDIKEISIAVFGPFLEKYNYSFPEEWGAVKTPLKSKLEFLVLGVLRKLNQKYFKKSKYKIGLEGTIYGDMQRN